MSDNNNLPFDRAGDGVLFLKQAQDILENLLKSTVLEDFYVTKDKIKEALILITSANDSAVRMEEKLKEYKNNLTTFKE